MRVWRCILILNLLLGAGAVRASQCRKVLQAGNQLTYVDSSTESWVIHRLLAQQAGLSPGEIEALQRNFHSKRVEDGSTGIFRIGDQRVLDASTNLIRAYKNLTSSWARSRQLRVQDVIDVRKTSTEVLSLDGGQELAPGPTRFHAGGRVAKVYGSLHPEVEEKLRRYGYEVTRRNESGFSVRYPDALDPMSHLQRYVDRINLAVRLGLPPEFIAAHAVQELLILHPFEGGNGRTARVIGQALYKVLTGRDLIFPPEFFKEMGYSLVELATALVPEASDVQKALLKAVAEKADFLLEGPVSVAQVPAPHEQTHDQPFFPEFLVDGVSHRYQDVPAEWRRYDQTLYFGKVFESEEAARKYVELVFTYGRTSRGRIHKDVARHVGDGTKTPSGFFQTTKDLWNGYKFATMGGGQRRFGVLLFIDPRKAEVLDVEELTKPYIWHFAEEHEVLFAGTLDPRRIRGAQIVEYAPPLQVLGIILNPNYQIP